MGAGAVALPQHLLDQLKADATAAMQSSSATSQHHVIIDLAIDAGDAGSNNSTGGSSNIPQNLGSPQLDAMPSGVFDRDVY
jgi:hypothetical protein